MKTAILTYNGVNAEDIEGCTYSKENGNTVLTYNFKKKDDRKSRYSKKASTQMAVVCFLLIVLVAFIGIGTVMEKANSLKQLRGMTENRVIVRDIAITTVEPEEVTYTAPVEPIEKEVKASNEVEEKANFSRMYDNDKVLGKVCSVPTYVDTSFKAYMDYRTITDTTSVQYEMQQNAWTGLDGVRRCGDDICVAMGTHYATECGKRFCITLDTGKSFNVIVADIKANKDTDETNRYSTHGEDNRACIIEFIVDVNEIGETARILGDISCNNFEGKVVEIVEL